MQRSPLKELNSNMQNGPILILKNMSKPNYLANYPSPQVKSVELSSHSSTEATVEGPAQLDVVNVGYCGKRKGKGLAQAPDASAHTAPKTPSKTSILTSKPETPPLTPLANLKVLIAAASTAREKESGQQGDTGGVAGIKCETYGGLGAGSSKEVEDGGGRKMKSLAILCKRFLSIAESEIGVGTDFSLESMSKKLGTNRRRIYDIINVLEALEMIVKQSKNWYTWLGQENLLVTLAKMRAMAEDDTDFRSLLRKENNGMDPSKENHPPPASSPAAVPALEGGACKMEESNFCLGAEDGCSVAGGGRWDKSLGVLCQKFIMLFLVTPENEVTLDFAGNILMPDDGSISLQPTNPKTKVRRLYDIANVLTTLGLIRKKTFLAPNHRKMPGYSWSGPSLDQIQAISVFRKSEFNLYPFYSKKKGSGGGVALTRKPSFGSMRPFLHQYEVKGQVTCGPNSAPSSPVKTKESGFKRSLSFGAGVGGKKGHFMPPPPQASKATPPQHVVDAKEDPVVTMCATPLSQIAPASGKRVVARQLSPGQVDYILEVREFEAEIQRHAHKYPHVAPVFSEFVNRFQSTLEQAAGNSTSVSPKSDASPAAPFNLSPNELAFFTPHTSPTPLGVASGPSGNHPPSTNCVNVSPDSVPGSGNATPSTRTAGIPMSKPDRFTTSDRNAGVAAPNHTHCASNVQAKGLSVVVPSSVPAVGSTSYPSSVLTSGPIPYPGSISMDAKVFNPNSLLVSTANGSFSIFPCCSPSSTSYLPFPCYSLPLSSTCVMPGVKATGGGSRSLAPKPLSSAEQPCTSNDKEDVSPAKRARLDFTTTASTT